MWRKRKTTFLVVGIPAVAALLLYLSLVLGRPDYQGGHEEAKVPATQRVNEEQLANYLGLTAEDVVGKLELGSARWYWTDEPPCVLRGVTYYLQDDTSVTLYIDNREPLYRRFNEQREWDYKAFLACRVGGIQYRSPEKWFDVGVDVPWQFRRP